VHATWVVRAAFVGVYGIGTPTEPTCWWFVRRTCTGTTATKSGHQQRAFDSKSDVTTGGGVASFWLDGLDIPVGNPPGGASSLTRCWPGCQVR